MDGIANLPGSAMLPLSRPLFDANAARLMTLCVTGALLAGTLAMIAVLTV